jgi:hypothetical protein
MLLDAGIFAGRQEKQRKLGTESKGIIQQQLWLQVLLACMTWT